MGRQCLEVGHNVGQTVLLLPHVVMVHFDAVAGHREFLLRLVFIQQILEVALHVQHSLGDVVSRAAEVFDDARHLHEIHTKVFETLDEVDDYRRYDIDILGRNHR